ncbi:MAG: MinD/ParA family protein [Candidatus Zixiibacteriota bacterium]|nr:MAG: MinD/ParA family protein [candidate division Zixibacteria bacterium]
MIKDQASKLRDLSKIKRLTDEHLHPVRRLAVTSGKGGVGKSNLSLNLGLAWQKLGRRTLLVDADTNLANIDILLGITPKYTLADAILRGAFIADVLVDGPEGLRILPAGSGVVEMVGLDDLVQDRLVRGLEELEKSRDLVLLDTGAGIHEGVVELAGGCDEVIFVTTPEPTAITDAYAAIKVISSRNAAIKPYLLVNQARSSEESEEVSRKICLVVENYLAIHLEPLGFLPLDPHVPQAVARQTPFLLAYPRCPASLNLMMIARRLLKLPPSNSGGTLFRQLFFRSRTHEPAGRTK